LSCPNAIQLRVFLIHPAPAETSTLSLHDALPISSRAAANGSPGAGPDLDGAEASDEPPGIDRTPKMYIGGRQTRPDGGYTRRIQDRKSTRLNSSHVKISYAVFCLKKKKQKNKHLH